MSVDRPISKAQTFNSSRATIGSSSSPAISFLMPTKIQSAKENRTYPLFLVIDRRVAGLHALRHGYIHRSVTHAAPPVVGREVHRINTPIPIAAALDAKENFIFVQFLILRVSSSLSPFTGSRYVTPAYSLTAYLLPSDRGSCSRHQRLRVRYSERGGDEPRRVKTLFIGKKPALDGAGTVFRT